MYLVGGSKDLDIVLFVVVDPEIVKYLNIGDVVDVMTVCCVDSLSLMSVCENVCVFVYTSDELAFVDNELVIVL